MNIASTYNNKNRFYYLFGLIALSVITTGYLLTTHRVIATSDWLFHSSRVEEIYRNLRSSGGLTFISARYFHNSGAGSFLFYPDVYLYLWALFRFLFSPITAFYVWVCLIQIIASLISYYSVVNVTRNQLVAFIFTILYVYAPYRLYLSYFVFGEFVGTAFIPLVFCGLYRILWGDREWKTFGVGLALTGYAHILSVVLALEVTVIIIIIWVVQKRWIEWERLWRIVYGGALSLALVSFELVPFFTDFLNKDISTARMMLWAPYNIEQFIVNSLGMVPGGSIGFFLLITLVIGWRFISNGYDLAIYLMAVWFFFMSTSNFPWKWFEHTPLTIVQMSYRYLIYASLFLAILLAKQTAEYIQWNSTSDKGVRLWGLAVMVVAIMSILGGLQPKGESMVNGSIPILKKSTSLKMQQLPTSILNRQNYQSQFNYLMPNGEFDYYPRIAFNNLKKQKSIVRHVTYINHDLRYFPIDTGANRISYTINLKHRSIVDLPVIKYAHTRVMVNGVRVRAGSSDRGTILLRLNQGRNVVTSSYQPSRLFYLMLFQSLLTWGGLTVYWVVKQI